MADLVGAFTGGFSRGQQMVKSQQQAGISANALARNNKFNAFLDNPANMRGGFEGDANALTALAAASGDPMLALKLRDKQLSMQGSQLQNSAIQQDMDHQQKKFEAEIAAQAAQMTAAERKAAAETTRRAVQAGMTAQTPAQWDALAQQMGQPDLVGKFEMREGLLATYLSAADIMERFDEQNAPAAPMSAPGKVQADINAGLLPEGTALRSQGQSRTVYDANGNVVYAEGAAPPKMTVDAAKNSGFLIRTEAANQVLDTLEDQGTRWGQQQLENVPLGLGNFARDEDFQKFDQARRDFVNAILRRESGAVISDQEFDNADKQYFPMPGDGPEVIAQKRANRKAAIEGLRLGSGPGAAYIEQKAAAQPQGANPFIDLSDAEFGQLDINSLSAEEIDMLLEARQ